MSASFVLACLSAAIGGMLVAAQGPIYARLSAGLNHDPLAAVSVAFLTATIAAGFLVVGLGNWRSITTASLGSLPRWVWLGGLLGACHVVISMQTIPRIGLGAFLVLVIAGNLIGAGLYDHFGAFGMTPRPFTAVRFAGLTIVLIGALVTAKTS
jgi:transporter family-2 protein